MTKINKSDAANDHDSSCSSFSCFPDEIVLEVLSKLIDLKTLCVCKLVSKRFYRIVLQVEDISYHAVSLEETRSFYGYPFKSLKEFTKVKSLCIQLSGYSNHALLKWKIKFGNRLDSFLSIIMDSILMRRNHYMLMKTITTKKIYYVWNRAIAKLYFQEVTMWHNMLMDLVKDFPLLEKVSIMDSGKGGRISIAGGKIAQLRENGKSINTPYRVSEGRIPLLELPVSEYVMKTVSLMLFERNDLPEENDSFAKCDDEDDFGDAYNEAVKKILNKDAGLLKRGYNFNMFFSFL